MRLPFRLGLAALCASLIGVVALAQTSPSGQLRVTQQSQQYEPGALVWRRYAQRTAHIEAIGTLYNGDVERQAGSGLLVNPETVITNSHVALLESNYKTLTLNVRVFDRNSQPVTATVVARDVRRDLAALKLAQPFNTKGCPIYARLDPPNELTPGSSLFALGFPLNRQLSINGKGVLSSKAPDRWQTDVALNPGNSGGPFFDRSLHFVGLGVSGITETAEGIRVVGVNFLIPVSELVASDVGKYLLDDCWNTKFDTAELESSFANITQSLTTALPETIRRTYPLKFVSKGGAETFSRTLEPVPNYRITQCELDEQANRGAYETSCQVTENNTAVVKVQMKAEPLPDRPASGWWIGSATLGFDRRL